MEMKSDFFENMEARESNVSQMQEHMRENITAMNAQIKMTKAKTERNIKWGQDKI